MQPGELTVFIVDDDASVRDSLALMLGLAGYRTALFADAEALLVAWNARWAGCVIADLRLPGRSGVELQTELRNRGSRLPVVIITAHGDVPTARAAFRAEAVDFLEKPFDHAQLREAIEKAFAREQRRIGLEQERAADAAKLAALTPREREVLQLLAEGKSNKEVAVALEISPKTVETHRARIFAKLHLHSMNELVRYAIRNQVIEP